MDLKIPDGKIVSKLWPMSMYQVVWVYNCLPKEDYRLPPKTYALDIYIYIYIDYLLTGFFVGDYPSYVMYPKFFLKVSILRSSHLNIGDKVSWVSSGATQY